MKSEIEKLTKKIAALERAQSLERNKYVDSINVPM
jgi:hypothetical protein